MLLSLLGETPCGLKYLICSIGAKTAAAKHFVLRLLYFSSRTFSFNPDSFHPELLFCDRPSAVSSD